jgi:UDP-MurNAc hydroxylase
VNVQLVAQASLLVETRGVRILSDPWYWGAVYGDAWELCPPAPDVPDLAGLDGLYISHGHPDHFHPPTLKRLLPAIGPDVTVFVPRLYFDTVARALRSIGFRNVVEMAPGRAIAWKGLTLFSQQFRLNDSLLVIQGDETLVNLNDCPIRGRALRDLARRFPRPDYVFAQFSVAQAYPYCYEGTARDWDKGALVERFDSYAEVLAPRTMVPFASFVRFCNEDNRGMNAHRTSLDELHAGSRATLTVLYPGDRIAQGSAVRAPGSQRRYEEAMREDGRVLPARTASRDDVDAALREFLAALGRDVPAFLRRFVPRARIVLNDLPWRVSLDLARGVHQWHDAVPGAPLETSADEPIAYRMSAGTLRDAAAVPWGWSNLQIGAKFRARVEPGWEGKEYWFWIVPILGREGYLRLWSLWFLRPRSLRVTWGRRAEVIDYLKHLASGSFMTDVVREKADF